jgi:hypothetical protein
MAHAQNDANENHWPGYVDALTTMLMVLTFVMMILGIAVFAMSQNVSRIIVEAIARAALIEPPIDDVPVPVLTERILEKLRLYPPRPPVKTAEQPRTEAVGAQLARIQSVVPDETRTSTPPAMLGKETRLVSTEAAHVPPAPDPVRSQIAGQALVLEFQPRATRLDEAASTVLAQTLDEARFKDAGIIEIRALVPRASASVTDARRVAYYRAMLVRASLLQRGVPAARLRIFTDENADTTISPSSGELVRVIPLIRAP